MVAAQYCELLNATELFTLKDSSYVYMYFTSM